MDLLRQYALRFVGLPYRWGGDDAIHGYDCSGLVQEILASAGEDPPGDQTAQALFDYYSQGGRGEWNRTELGSLCFYGKNAGNISHIGFCLDQYRMIEAGGGGRNTKTKEDAALQNAYVRVRLIASRKDLQAVIKPRYNKIGCF